MMRMMFFGYQFGVPTLFVFAAVEGWGTEHPRAATFAIFAASLSWLWLMEHESFRVWAPAEGGLIARWFG